MRATHLSVTIAAIALLTACGTGEQSKPGTPELLPQTQAISECGGFELHQLSKIIQPPQSYCDAEVLRWSHDPQSATLAFANERVLLNCCGERSMKLTEVNGQYLLQEVDSPEQVMTAGGPEGARCDCTCVFDLQVEAQQIPGGTIQVRLVREITDSGPAQTLFAGTIDLSAGSGSIIIDTSPVFDASGRCMP